MQEFGAEGLPLALTKDTLDRMMMARLLDPPEQYPQWPLDYLIGCYGRVSQEIRALTLLKDKNAADAIQLDLQYCKQLISRNAGLLLSMALFPQVTSTCKNCLTCNCDSSDLMTKNPKLLMYHASLPYAAMSMPFHA